MTSEMLGSDRNNFWRNKSWEAHVRRNNPTTKDLPRMDKGLPCVHCGDDDQVFPSPVVTVCPRCLKRVDPRAVRMVTKNVLDLDGRGPGCMFCSSRNIQMYSLYAYICHKCTLSVTNRLRGRRDLRSIGARW